MFAAAIATLACRTDDGPTGPFTLRGRWTARSADYVLDLSVTRIGGGVIGAGTAGMRPVQVIGEVSPSGVTLDLSFTDSPQGAERHFSGALTNARTLAGTVQGSAGPVRLVLRKE